MLSSAFCAEICRKDFLKAEKAEPRRAAGRGVNTEASDRGKAGEIWEKWPSMETPSLKARCTGRQRNQTVEGLLWSMAIMRGYKSRQWVDHHDPCIASFSAAHHAWDLCSGNGIVGEQCGSHVKVGNGTKKTAFP
jgi:hypothetical protein